MIARILNQLEIARSCNRTESSIIDFRGALSRAISYDPIGSRSQLHVYLDLRAYLLVSKYHQAILHHIAYIQSKHFVQSV